LRHSVHASHTEEEKDFAQTARSIARQLKPDSVLWASEQPN